MSEYWAVFADRRFEGLFRSRAAARRWAAELATMPVRWWEVPCVEACDTHSTFPHRDQTRGRLDAIKAIECRWFGRRT